jgi:hypothetical protein
MAQPESERIYRRLPSGRLIRQQNIANPPSGSNMNITIQNERTITPSSAQVCRPYSRSAVAGTYTQAAELGTPKYRPAPHSILPPRNR